MSRTVEKATPEQNAALVKAIETWHHWMRDIELRVGLVAVRNEDGPALTHHGHPCLAKVRRLGERDRLLTRLDAVIEIDAEAFDDLGDGQQLALIDHELTHLELVSDRAGTPKLARDGRPKLRLRPDDYFLTGFFDVVARHGNEACERLGLARVLHRVGQQLTFAWQDGSEMRMERRA